MSNVYQPKRKELAKVKVVSTQTYDDNRSKLKFIGRIKRGYTTFITTQSNKKQVNVKSVYDATSYFDFTPTGRIKGSYNANGFFEPD